MMKIYQTVVVKLRPLDHDIHIMMILKCLSNHIIIIKIIKLQEILRKMKINEKLAGKTLDWYCPIF